MHCGHLRSQPYNSSLYFACLTGTEELRVSKITLLIPTGSADQPFNVRSFRNATMTGLKGTLENLNASTVLPVSDLTTAVTADTTEVPMLSDIQLHDQGTYLVVLERLPLEMQVRHAGGTAVCFGVCRACSGSTSLVHTDTSNHSHRTACRAARMAAKYGGFT